MSAIPSLSIEDWRRKRVAAGRTITLLHRA